MHSARLRRALQCTVHSSAHLPCALQCTSTLEGLVKQCKAVIPIINLKIWLDFKRATDTFMIDGRTVTQRVPSVLLRAKQKIRDKLMLIYQSCAHACVHLTQAGGRGTTKQTLTASDTPITHADGHLPPLPLPAPGPARFLLPIHGI